MNQTFTKTDYSKLFFIRMGLIFPKCLIYTPVTETLLKETFMKKEEEFLCIVSQSIYVRGLSREWSGTGMIKKFMPRKSFSGLCCSQQLVQDTAKKICALPVPFPNSVLSFFLTHCWRTLASSSLPESFSGGHPTCLFRHVPEPAGSSSAQ